MFTLLASLLTFGLLAGAAVIDAPIKRQASGVASGAQAIPSSAKADGTFNNGAAERTGEPPDTSDTPPDIYGARDIDIPFYRLWHGNISFFPKGQLNTPDGDTDKWGAQYDSAKQSACGIPDNAFTMSKVAIHPYFLKYADLSRYCMQDVCISFWKEDGSSDMMLKVTDICSTDPSDPTHCANPGDIKIDRTKAQIWLGMTGGPVDQVPQLAGNTSPEKTYWFFMKCWDDGLAQTGYEDNWFTTPALPNNLHWAQSTAMQQYTNNQNSYGAKGWPTYPNGGYNTERDDKTSPPVSDWVPGKEPSYEPVAGGKGFGQPSGSASDSGSSSGSSSGAATGNSATNGTQTSSSSSAVHEPVAPLPTGQPESNDVDDECEA